jgi:hypothetical protein
MEKKPSKSPVVNPKTDTKNPSKGTAGTNTAYDKNQSNCGKKKDSNQGSGKKK